MGFHLAALGAGKRHDSSGGADCGEFVCAGRWKAPRFVRWRRPWREVATEVLPDAGHAGGLDVRADHLTLWQEIRRLPPRMRATLVLRYVEDLTEEATARELGVSIGSVKSQTHHALKRLRAALPDLELQP